MIQVQIQMPLAPFYSLSVMSLLQPLKGSETHILPDQSINQSIKTQNQLCQKLTQDQAAQEPWSGVAQPHAGPFLQHARQAYKAGHTATQAACMHHVFDVVPHDGHTLLSLANQGRHIYAWIDWALQTISHAQTHIHKLQLQLSFHPVGEHTVSGALAFCCMVGPFIKSLKTKGKGSM